MQGLKPISEARHPDVTRLLSLFEAHRINEDHARMAATERRIREHGFTAFYALPEDEPAA